MQRFVHSLCIIVNNLSMLPVSGFLSFSLFLTWLFRIKISPPVIISSTISFILRQTQYIIIYPIKIYIFSLIFLSDRFILYNARYTKTCKLIESILFLLYHKKHWQSILSDDIIIYASKFSLQCNITVIKEFVSWLDKMRCR